MKIKEIIESHSSAITNKRLGYRFDEIDRAGVIAANNLHLSNITAYYNAVEQTYINVKDILDEEIFKKTERIRKIYQRLYLQLLEDKEKVTPRNLYCMLRLIKLFNSLLVSGLQKKKYFFRVGSQDPRGLNTIDLFDTVSIFKGVTNGEN